MTEEEQKRAQALETNFSSDLPITSAKQDLLGRAGFAAGVAKAIRNWHEKSSLVIGLFGDWGSGKSSLKNMILEGLHEGVPENDRLPVVEFNPWQVSDPERLAQSFFDEIGVALGGPQTGENEADAKKRAAKWRAYSAYLNIGGSITKSLKVVLPLLGVPLVGDLADGIVTALEKSGGVAKEGAEGIEAAGKASVRTLAELKQEVAASLESLPRPVLAVLDDVDRLTQDEIRLLFQLIKANADFPNLIYLVLAQRDTVVKALDRIAPDRGEAFLEKIVQVGLTVPRIERRQLEKTLFAGLDRYLVDPRVRQRFDQEQWVKLYREGLRPFFQNLRDVHRYLSSFGFHVGVFRSGSSFEVNPVDLIALEALRVFVPTVYEALPDLKHILTDEPRFMRKEEKKEDSASLIALLESAPTDVRPQVQSVLENLFPPAASVLSNSHYSEGNNDWFRNLRVCAHEVFDRYFQFSTPAGDISQSELDAVMALVGDRDALAKKFTDLRERGLLDVTLDRLDYYKDKLPIQAAESFVTVLFDLDVSSDDQFLALQLSPQTHLQRILYWYLRQEQDLAKRKGILQSAMAKTTGLFTPVMAINWLEARTRDNGPGDSDALLQSPADIDDLRRQSVAKIEDAAKSGRLPKEKELWFLLTIWGTWGGNSQMRQWVENVVASGQDGLLQILRTLRGTMRAYGGPIPKEIHYYRLSDVERYIDPGMMLGLIEKLDIGSLSEDDAANVKLFRQALDRRAQGKPDFDFMSVD